MTRPRAVWRLKGRVVSMMSTQTGAPSTSTASVTDSPVRSTRASMNGRASVTNSEWSSET